MGRERALQHALGGFLPGSPSSFVPVVYTYKYIHIHVSLYANTCVYVCACERESQNVVVRGGMSALPALTRLHNFFNFRFSNRGHCQLPFGRSRFFFYIKICTLKSCMQLLFCHVSFFCFYSVDLQEVKWKARGMMLQLSLKQNVSLQVCFQRSTPLFFFFFFFLTYEHLWKCSSLVNVFVMSPCTIE